MVLGIYKGTAVNDSNSNITISQIGTDIGGSMDEDKTYMYSQDFSSGNTLSQGDFILFTIQINNSYILQLKYIMKVQHCVCWIVSYNFITYSSYQSIHIIYTNNGFKFDL